jgi:DNA invertase Pin-like site-specific DNA recombinase
VTARTGRAVGYVRVSTDQQAESGLGLEAQEAALAGAASRLRLELVRVFVDAGTSGKLAIEDRPVLLDAVTTLKRGDVLLVAKRDRLGRDVIAVAMIERLIAKRGARIVSAAGEGTETDDPAALLMRRLIDSFAEYERALIAARTRAALAAKRRRGERVSGRLPFGYKLAADRRTLLMDEDEQRTVVAVAQLHAAGCSLRRIADELNQRGSRTRSGALWRHQYVAAMVRASCVRSVA